MAEFTLNIKINDIVTHIQINMDPIIPSTIGSNKCDVLLNKAVNALLSALSLCKDDLYITTELEPPPCIKKTPVTYVVKDRNELDEILRDCAVDADLNYLDVSNVTDMSMLFHRTIFNGDISKWDVSNVVDMTDMFRASKFNGDISNWNTSNVLNMAGMFSYSYFNTDISYWEVGKVTNMDNMFCNSKFNVDISNWDVSNVRSNKNMFMNSSHTGALRVFKNTAVTDTYKERVEREKRLSRFTEDSDLEDV